MTPVRVLVVDDSVVIRRLLVDLLQEVPEIEVVGKAVNGRDAVAKQAALRPDVITMDIEMPELDGIGAVKELRRLGCRTPIIMFSTLTARGAEATLDALASGATDYVTKPANVGHVTQAMEQVRDELVPRILSLAGRPRRPVAPAAPARPAAAAPVAAPTRPRVPTAPVRLIAVGSSTGGPEALHTVFSTLPVLPVPVVIVQHMPPVFTAHFAARLDRVSAWEVCEVAHDVPLRPGTVSIAPGDFHLEVLTTRSGFVSKLSQGPQENYCRPAVDVLFRSVARAAADGVLSIVLTGMGHDGREGAGHIRKAGGSVVVQDQASSVVWGMPGAVAGAGLADAILPLAQIGSEISRRTGSAPRTPAGLATAGARP